MNKLVVLLTLFFSQISYAGICDPTPAPTKNIYLERNASPVKKIKVSLDILEHNDFVFKSGNGPYSTYFTLDLPFAPAKEVYSQLEKLYPHLKNRGEAHITILTPVEFNCAFKKYGVTMEEIKEVIKKDFPGPFQDKILSLGSGSKQMNGNLEETFFLITEGLIFFKMREEIAKLLPKNQTEFKPQKYAPHITIGFTKRDLHESDGIFKNETWSRDPRFPTELIGQ